MCEIRPMANASEVESFEKKIQGKTRLLESIREETEQALASREKVQIERPLRVYQSKLSEI